MKNPMRMLAAGALITLAMMTVSVTGAEAKKKARGQETPPTILHTDSRSSASARLESAGAIHEPKRFPDNPLSDLIGWIENSSLWSWESAN